MFANQFDRKHAMDRREIEEVVLRVIEQELAIPRQRIRLDDRFVADLKVDSDDLSFLLVPAVKRELSVDPPMDAWQTVFTVRDVVDLVIRLKSLE